MHSLVIKSVQSIYSPADHCDVLDVTVIVTRDEKLLGERRFTYPLGTPEGHILEDLKKTKETLDSDYNIHLESQNLGENLKASDELKQSLTGKTI